MSEQDMGAPLRDGLGAPEGAEPDTRLGATPAIPSAYGEPVTTLEDLDALDSDEVVEGYNDGLANEPAPTGNRSRAYWHGWRNGMADGGHMEIDPAMRELARQVVAKSKEQTR